LEVYLEVSREVLKVKKNSRENKVQGKKFSPGEKYSQKKKVQRKPRLMPGTAVAAVDVPTRHLDRMMLRKGGSHHDASE
jgi:hypothetical protein